MNSVNLHRSLALLESMFCLGIVFLLLLGLMDVGHMQEIFKTIWKGYFKLIQFLIVFVLLSRLIINIFWPSHKTWEVSEPASKQDVEVWLARLDVGVFKTHFNHSKSASWVLRQGKTWLAWEWLRFGSLCVFLFWAVPTLNEGFLGLLKVPTHTPTHYMEILHGTTKWGEPWYPVRSLEEGKPKTYRKVDYSFEGYWENVSYHPQSLLPSESMFRWSVKKNETPLFEKTFKSADNFLFPPEPDFRFRYLGPTHASPPVARFIVKKRNTNVAVGAFTIGLSQSLQLQDEAVTLVKIERGLERFEDGGLLRWSSGSASEKETRDYWFFTQAPQLDSQRRKQTPHFFELVKIDGPLVAVFAVTEDQIPFGVVIVFGLLTIAMVGSLSSRRATLRVHWQPDKITVRLMSAHLPRWGDWMERLNAELGK